MSSLRERNRQATLATIQSAALDLVLEHGFAQVTVEQICQAAGVSRRTFFNYFPSKDSALLGSCRPQLGSVEEHRRAYENWPVEDVVVDTLAFIAEHMPPMPTAEVLDKRTILLDRQPEVLKSYLSQMEDYSIVLADMLAARLESQPGLAKSGAPAHREAQALAAALTAVVNLTVRDAAACQAGQHIPLDYYLLSLGIVRDALR